MALKSDCLAPMLALPLGDYYAAPAAIAEYPDWMV